MKLICVNCKEFSQLNLIPQAELGLTSPSQFFNEAMVQMPFLDTLESMPMPKGLRKIMPCREAALLTIQK